MTVLLRDDFTGSGSIDGRTPDGVHTGTWADDSYFGGAASNTNITGGELIPLTPFRFGASIAMAGSPTDAYIDVHLLTSDVTYPVGAKTLIGLGTTIGSNTTGVFCAFTRTDDGFGGHYLDLDLTLRHSDFASGTTTLTGVAFAINDGNFTVRLEVQGTAVSVLVDGAVQMVAVLNAPMAAGRAFIGAEFANTKFDYVQAGFLPVFTKPTLLAVSGTILLDSFSGYSTLQYNPPEFSTGAFTGVNYYFEPSNLRQNGWVSGGDTQMDLVAYYGGGAAGLSEVTVDVIFRTGESMPASYATSGDLIRIFWTYLTPNVETYDISIVYLTAADAIAAMGGGAVAGFYFKSSHLAVSAGVNPAVVRYVLLSSFAAEEVHHIRVDQFRSSAQGYYLDDVLIDTTTNPTAGGVHKLDQVSIDILSGGAPGPTVHLPILGGVRVMQATSFSGPPFFWRDLIHCAETR